MRGEKVATNKVLSFIVLVECKIMRVIIIKSNTFKKGSDTRQA